MPDHPQKLKLEDVKTKLSLVVVVVVVLLVATIP